MLRALTILAIIAGAVWWALSISKNTLAGWFWPDDAAPWETVDAYFYPNRSDLTVHLERSGLASVTECRAWVQREAEKRQDAQMLRGDYECAVGRLQSSYGMNVYRLTIN